MADYVKEMRALEGLLRQEEDKEMQDRESYNTGLGIANMMTPISKPSQGTAEIKLGITPMDRSGEMKEAWAGSAERDIDASTSRQKQLLQQYKMLQDAKTKGDALTLKAEALKQQQSNFDRELALKKQIHRDNLVNKSKKEQSTIGQKTVDKEFAKEYVDYVGKGGFADTQKQILQLYESLNTLKSGANVSGTLTGLTPDWIQSVTNPTAIETKERIEEVVQRNLRSVLGAQFTEKEGERLIKRAFNPYLSEQENTIRLQKLIKQITDAAQKKKEAMEYFEQNGTLTGFTGKLPKIEDFNMDEERPFTPQEGMIVVDDINSLSDDDLDKELGI